MLIVHGLLATALLGALTHQTWACLSSAQRSTDSGFIERFKTVPAQRYARAVALMWVLCFIWGGWIYSEYRISVRLPMEQQAFYKTLGAFELKEHLSVIGLGILYTLVMFAFVSAAGYAGTPELVNQQFSGEIASIFYPMTDKFFGSPLTYAFELFIVTGSFACQMAFFNTGCRYLFSMGREGVLPSALGRTHPKHKSPHIAGVVAGIFLVIYVGAFFLYEIGRAHV